jgi:hypothetical protein
MSGEIGAPARTERVATGRLWWVGPLAVIASVAANVVFTLIANAVFGVPPDFLPLTPDAIAMFTAVGVIGAVVVFALVARFSTRPIRLFRRIALVVLVVSFLPDLALPLIPDPVPAGPREVLILMATHVVPAAISVYLLTTLTRETAG